MRLQQAKFKTSGCAGSFSAGTVTLTDPAAPATLCLWRGEGGQQLGSYAQDLRTGLGLGLGAGAGAGLGLGLDLPLTAPRVG